MNVYYARRFFAPLHRCLAVGLFFYPIFKNFYSVKEGVFDV